MKKLFVCILTFCLILCGCDVESTGITKEDVEGYVIENETKWDDEFEDVFFTNFSMYIHWVQTVEDVTYKVDNLMMADENGVYVENNDILGEDISKSSYYIIKEEDRFVKYDSNDDNTRYELITDNIDENTYTKTIQKAQLYISFKSNYEKFVFNEEKLQYEATETIICDLNDEVYGENCYFEAYDAIVKFEEGKLVSMSGRYNGFELDEETGEYKKIFNDDIIASFEIFDINRTVVTAPTNIVTE